MNEGYRTTLTPSQIFHRLERILMGCEKDYTYIILGHPGPTGKTHLCDALKSRGYNAIEISEQVGNLVSYKDSKNHYEIDRINKTVTIVLNMRLD